MSDTSAAIHHDGRDPLAEATSPRPVRPPAATGRDRSRTDPEAVADLAARAAREVPGVYALGAPGPDGDTATTAPAGVRVQVDEPAATVDLSLVSRYGQNILDITGAVRRTVIERVEAATGLIVREVNITVDDLLVPGDVDPEAT